MVNILTGGNGLHDLVSLDLIVDLESEEIPRGSELELGDSVSLVLLDSDLFGLGEVLPLSAHNLDELLQILNLLGLRKTIRVCGGDLPLCRTLK